MDEVLDKDAFLGLYGVFLFLAVFLNLFLLALVLFPLNRHSSLWPFHRLLPLCPFLHLHPVVSRKSPKHVVIVAVCVSNLLAAFLHHALVLHFYSARDAYSPPPVTCASVVTSEVSAYVFPALTRIFVAVVMVAEVQNMTSMDDVRNMTTACVLMVVAVMYALGVLLPVFFFLYLAYATEPCYPGKTILRYTSVASDGKVLSVLSYILPVVFIVTSLALLVFTYFWKKAKDESLGNAVSSKGYPNNTTLSPYRRSSGDIRNNGSPASVPQYNNGKENVFEKASFDNTNRGFSSNSKMNYLSPGSHADSKALAFPYDTALVGVLAVVLEFVFCVRQFAFWSQVDERLMSTSGWIRLWAADRVLSLLALSLIPCCWFFDPYVRDFFRGFGHVASPTEGHRVHVKEWATSSDAGFEGERQAYPAGKVREDIDGSVTEGGVYENFPEDSGRGRSGHDKQDGFSEEWRSVGDAPFNQNRARFARNSLSQQIESHVQNTTASDWVRNEGNALGEHGRRIGSSAFSADSEHSRKNRFEENQERKIRNGSHDEWAQNENNVFDQNTNNLYLNHRVKSGTANGFQNQKKISAYSAFSAQRNEDGGFGAHGKEADLEPSGAGDREGRFAGNSPTRMGRGRAMLHAQSIPDQAGEISSDASSRRRQAAGRGPFGENRGEGGHARVNNLTQGRQGEDITRPTMTGNAYIQQDRNVKGNTFGRQRSRNELGEERENRGENTMYGERRERGGQVFSVPRRGVEQNAFSRQQDRELEPHTMSNAQNGRSQPSRSEGDTFFQQNRGTPHNTAQHNRRPDQDTHLAGRGGSNMLPELKSKLQQRSTLQQVGGVGQKLFGEQKICRNMFGESRTDHSAYREHDQRTEQNSPEEGRLHLGHNRFRDDWGREKNRDHFPANTGRNVVANRNRGRADDQIHFNDEGRRMRNSGPNPESEC